MTHAQPEFTVPHASARAGHDPMIRVRDAHLHNLKHVDIAPMTPEDPQGVAVFGGLIAAAILHRGSTPWRATSGSCGRA